MPQTLAINTVKTTEAIALLLELHQKPMILGQLLKTIYFVDRLFLSLANYSLTNDNYLGKKSGLVPKHIPELIQQLQRDSLLSISAKDTGYVVLNRCPQTNTLTNIEIETIKQVYTQKKDLNPFNLLDWDYDLEFIKNHVRTRRTILITPLDIMYSLDKTIAEIEIYLNLSESAQSKVTSAVGSFSPIEV